MKTFKEQYDKLVKAYLQNKVEPLNSCACFVGNLLNGRHQWALTRTISYQGDPITWYTEEGCKIGIDIINEESDNTYTVEEIALLEDAFMQTWSKIRKCSEMSEEDSIFLAFEAGLLKLREIHELKGEIIEDYTFTKRNLELV